MEKKRFKVKEKYKKVAETLIRENVTGDIIIFENSPAYNLFEDKGVLDEFCEEIPQEPEPWKDVNLKIETRQSIQEGFLDKAVLLIRMQSWADFHNKLDGFMVDWNNDSSYKWGIDINKKSIRTDFSNTFNTFLFQISVGSDSRAKQMRTYFYEEIVSLIEKKLI